MMMFLDCDPFFPWIVGIGERVGVQITERVRGDCSYVGNIFTYARTLHHHQHHRQETKQPASFQDSISSVYIYYNIYIYIYLSCTLLLYLTTLTVPYSCSLLYLIKESIYSNHVPRPVEKV